MTQDRAPSREVQKNRIMREEKSGATFALLFGAVLLIVAASCSLRQDKETVAPTGKSASFVANPFCMACHANFEEETLAATHKAAGIGCERCHGESFRHRSDEANVTPPDLMYPKERINPTCMMCHPRQQIPQTASHQPILEVRLSPLETAASDGQTPKYCTDCHGIEHHMKVRTTRWDKCTGKRIQ